MAPARLGVGQHEAVDERQDGRFVLDGGLGQAQLGHQNGAPVDGADAAAAQVIQGVDGGGVALGRVDADGAQQVHHLFLDQRVLRRQRFRH